VIIPKHSRNVYDAALRAVGVRVIEVSTPEELDRALGPRTAMVYVLAGPRADAGPLTTRTIAERTRPLGVPVLVDAAAEILTIPNVHLEAGADLVGYSGGKCLRGPQTAGLLLGRESLVRAAWVHGAPHHGFARGLKVGKEEAVGMLMAVEMWVRRDHEAEWAQWSAWLEHIAGRVSAIDGVTTELVQPAGLSNRTPSLKVLWDPERLGITGARVAETLFEGEPRVALVHARDEDGRSGVSITPYMLSPGDERIVAEELHALLADPPPGAVQPDAPPAADLSGSWDVHIEYLAGESRHTLHLRQRQGELDGIHAGEFVSRALTGRVTGDAVRIRSLHTEESGDALSFTFSGRLRGEILEGTLDMGEYLGARWKAHRHPGA
jgi:L-seryl-tRNA(Ser) seleniumtransferase